MRQPRENNPAMFLRFDYISKFFKIIKFTFKAKTTKNRYYGSWPLYFKYLYDVPFKVRHKSEEVSTEDVSQPEWEVSEEPDVEEPVVQPTVPHSTHGAAFPRTSEQVHALRILVGRTNLNLAIENTFMKIKFHWNMNWFIIHHPVTLWLDIRCNTFSSFPPPSLKIRP